MHRLTVLCLAIGLGLTVAACEEEEPREEVREEMAEVAEERRETAAEVREEYADLREEYRELRARMQQLPPEDRRRLHEEMYRDMQRDTLGGMPHHPPGQGPGMGMMPDTMPADTGSPSP